MRNLIVCCDGTWNTAEQRDAGVPVPTNVVRVYNALAATNRDGVAQLKYYHPGVGTEPSWWDRTKGGSTGAGLDRNIISAYHWLCRHYQSGDRMYLFGFSRGAYTARSLAGLVACCGLLKLDDIDAGEVWNSITRIFERGYRQRDLPARHETRASWEQLGWRFHTTADGDAALPIHLVGVWDTVGALGIPDDLALLNLLDANDEHAFHDVTLSAQIRNARHAVALDEIRANFQPTLWAGPNDARLKQVWFPGVHCDVGGGYRETGLSDGALKWMIDEAAALDLGFDAKMTDQIKPDPRGVLHDSYVDMFRLLPNMPRSVPDLDDPANDDVVLHASVRERRECPPISHAPYRASSAKLSSSGATLTFSVYAMNPWNAAGLYLEKGVTYRFEAEGEWLDRSVACGPGGTHDGDFQPAEAMHAISSALGELEGLFRKFTGNEAANFKFTKRHDRLQGKRVPWFCLVGAVASGGNKDSGEPSQHETFIIGSRCEYTPQQSGYFYAYANDAWNFYENNRGSVTLTITRL